MLSARQYLFSKLAEEASEIVQIALKCQQFGVDDVYETLPNEERLFSELDDLTAVVEELNRLGLGYASSDGRKRCKKIKIARYLEYAIQRGQVEPKAADLFSDE